MSRYINADELKNAFTNWREIVNNPYDLSPSVEECKAVIDAQPTADVAEVRHGRWMQDGTGYHAKCSVCGEIVYRGWYYSFCPNCGALMVSEDE